MEFKIKTTELQEMVGRVSQCVSNNKLIPLTSLMSIAVEDGTLILTTTNATEYYYSYSESDVDCEDFEVSVLADLFTKLIQKITTEEIKISVENEQLKVLANGVYTFELPLDENGIIKFPKKLKDDFCNDLGQIELQKVKDIISTNKASLATGMEIPVLTTYYCGDSVITSDQKTICRYDVKTLEKPILIPETLMELLSTVSSDTINVAGTDKGIWFTTTHEIIYTPATMSADEFPVTKINELINREFTSSCKVSRTKMLSIIDRLALFVNAYDKKGIYMSFDKESITFSSKKSSGTESVKFEESNNALESFFCCINVEMLKSQLETFSSESIMLYYGSELAIKLTDKNITEIIALIDERSEQNG